LDNAHKSSASPSIDERSKEVPTIGVKSLCGLTIATGDDDRSGKLNDLSLIVGVDNWLSSFKGEVKSFGLGA